MPNFHFDISIVIFIFEFHLEGVGVFQMRKQFTLLTRLLNSYSIAFLFFNNETDTFD